MPALTPRNHHVPLLVSTDLASYWTGRATGTIRRWAHEGRITRYGRHARGGARWDLRELPAAEPDKPLPPPPPLPAARLDTAA